MHILLLLDGAFMWLAKRLLWLTDFFGIGREAVVWFYTVCPCVVLALVPTQFPVPRYDLIWTEFCGILPISLFWTWEGLKAFEELERNGNEQQALPNLWIFDPKQRLVFLALFGLLPISFVATYPHSIAWLAILLPRGFQFYLLANYNIGSGVRLRDLAKSGLKKVRQVFTPRVPGPVSVPAT